MDVLEAVKTALSGTSVPARVLHYDNPPDTYITYFEFNEQESAWAENTVVAETRHIQVDIWSKCNYSAVASQVKTAMRAAGFFFSYAQDLYESDTQIYHKAMRFSIADDTP